MLTLEEAKKDYEIELKQKIKNKKIKTRCSTCIYHKDTYVTTFNLYEPPVKMAFCKVKDDYVRFNIFEALWCKYHQNNQIKNNNE